MYCNLSRIQGFPIAIRISLQQTSVKSYHTSISSPIAVGFCVNTKGDAIAEISSGFRTRRCNKIGFLRQGSVSVTDKLVSVANVIGRRGFSSLNPQRANERSSAAEAGNSLPWLESKAIGGAKKQSGSNSRSSWGESAKRLEKSSGGDSIWVASSETRTKERSPKKSSKTYVGDRRGGYKAKSYVRPEEDERMDEREEAVEEEEDMEVVSDPRWSEIKSRFDKYNDVRNNGGSGKPVYRKWDKQEAWGRRTWKEATESSVPKMVGEGVYGVGPVLAALSAQRREFYALYVQEGLDMSSNNRKKKDKKGFERILKMAEKIGLTVKEASKHDLNMVVENRPHQGLVLDASPLEMVKVKELDPITSDEERSSLWVALDEVTDPQNLGAIIRSAYFFGASGVVVCAKNSAPLSGVVSKSSAGSLEVMELRFCKNMMQFLTASAENGWRVIGGSVSSRAVSLKDVSGGAVPTILVLGNEGTGLRPLVERSCTELVRIDGHAPMDHGAGGEADDVEGHEFRSFLAVESLNVSVAAALLLHHLVGNKETSGSS